MHTDKEQIVIFEKNYDFFVLCLIQVTLYTPFHKGGALMIYFDEGNG